MEKNVSTKENHEKRIFSDEDMIKMTSKKDKKFRNRRKFYELDTFMILQFVEDSRYKIVEVENMDRFRIYQDVDFEFSSECHFLTVCQRAKFISYFDARNETLGIVSVRSKKTFEFDISDQMKKTYKGCLEYEPSKNFDLYHNMIFSSKSKYFFFCRGGEDGDGEIMVIDLKDDENPFLKYTIQTIGYPYLSQTIHPHKIYEDHLMCCSFADADHTFEVFKLKETKYEIIFQGILNNELSMNWSSDYLAYILNDDLEVFRFHHDSPSNNLDNKSDFSINFHELCRDHAGLEEETSVFRCYNSRFLPSRNEILHYYLAICDEFDGDYEGNVFMDLKNRRIGWTEFSFIEKSYKQVSNHFCNFKLEKKDIPDIHFFGRKFLPPEILIDRIIPFLEVIDIFRKIETISLGFRNNYSIWRKIYKRDWKMSCDYDDELKIEYLKRIKSRDPMLFLQNKIKWEKMEKKLKKKDGVGKKKKKKKKEN